MCNMMRKLIANTYIDYVQSLKKVKSNCVHLGKNYVITLSCDVHDNRKALATI